MNVRLLVTGFSAFPGAPVNPSEVLVERLRRDAPGFDGVDLVTRVLPVAYQSMPGLLGALGGEARPDIAIHFGLAETAKGFRLERIARNRSSLRAADAAGFVPRTPAIAVGGPRAARSSLPLDAIAERLRGLGLPVQTSDNAGAYLCNYLFYQSCTGGVDGFRPAMSGFVHVPFLDTQLASIPPRRASRLASLTEEELLRGAVAIMEICVAAAQATRCGGRSA
ncbi:MAG: pyroglutamyl-peptidase I [Mesorhizobium sp.]|nr:pyroglutamyl-peptidase I [Mesorhizobium sp.]